MNTSVSGSANDLKQFVAFTNFRLLSQVHHKWSSCNYVISLQPLFLACGGPVTSPACLKQLVVDRKVHISYWVMFWKICYDFHYFWMKTWLVNVTVQCLPVLFCSIYLSSHFRSSLPALVILSSTVIVFPTLITFTCSPLHVPSDVYTVPVFPLFTASSSLVSVQSFQWLFLTPAYSLPPVYQLYRAK